MFIRYVRIVAIVAAIVASGWYGRAIVLRAAASSWIVSDPLTRADAIVVLGGNLHPRVAAEMYQRGLADKVLVSQTPKFWQEPADLPSDAELNRDALIKLGVPAESIEFFGAGNTNTREEAVALKRWAERNASNAFIIPSETFAARRVRWIFHHEISSSHIAIMVPAYDPPYYSREDWWKSEKGVVAFQNEILKYIYYRLKY